MELGIIASNWGEEPFAKAKARGLSFLEYCVNVGSNFEDFENASDAILDFSKKYGVKIGSIGRWGADKITPDGEIIEEELSLAYRYIDQCEKLGSPVYVTGCNYVDGLSFYQNITRAISFFQKVVAVSYTHLSSVSIHGPTGANVSNPLALVHWPSRFCISRSVTSFKQV